MIVRFLFAANSINSSAWATVDVKGFSTKTCLPFWRAVLASSKWVQTGVITATASMFGEHRTSWASQVTDTEGYACLARRSKSADLSQITDNSQPFRP